MAGKKQVKIKAVWQGGIAFEGSNEAGQTVLMDSPLAEGGPKWPSPMQMVLIGLAGCTAMDVISILRKMKVKPDDFSVEAESEVADDHPKVFTKIKITYRLKGKDLPRNKVEKAVDLSMERYCGVMAMLQKAAPVEHEIVIEE